jgi:hypothetical protein
MITEPASEKKKKKKKQSVKEEEEEVEEGQCLQYHEVLGCLFSAPEHVSLAHCVAEDFTMGRGIAVMFRNKFNSKEYLLSQGKHKGDVAVLKLDSRCIFYLITKEVSYGKPTLLCLENSLLQLRNLCRQMNIHHLAMPKIGSGLDLLHWPDVKHKIMDIFKFEPINITIYTLPDTNCTYTNHTYSLWAVF